MKETQAGQSTVVYYTTPEGTYTYMWVELSRAVQHGSAEYICFNIVQISKKMKI